MGIKEVPDIGNSPDGRIHKPLNDADGSVEHRRDRFNTPFDVIDKEPDAVAVRQVVQPRKDGGKFPQGNV